MLPTPEAKPLLTVDELVDLVPALGRSATYEAVRRGEIPSVRYGRKVFIPVAELRRTWGLDPDHTAPAPAGVPQLAVVRPA